MVILLYVKKHPIGEKHGGVLPFRGEEMNETNWNMVVQAVGIGGDILTQTLPYSPRHPNGRNGYAHLWLCLKHKFGETKLLPDSQVNEVLEYIEWLVKNPR